MNIETFFTHWGIKENPFHAEEARDDTLGKIDTHSNAIASAREALKEGLETTTHQPTLDQHYRHYIIPSGRFYKETYTAIRRAATAGIGSDLIPVIEHVLGVMDTEIAFEQAIPVTRENDNPKATAEDPRTVIRGLLDEEKKGLTAQRSQSDSQFNKGVQFFRSKRYNEAYNLFHQSHELSNHNITCRAYIAWLQLRKRVVHRKRLDERASHPFVAPTAESLAAGVQKLATEFRDQKDPLRAAWLLTLVNNEPALIDVVDKDTRAALERQAASAVDPRETGRMAGLATRGGHFINGDLLPVSIALDTRKDFGTHYDFEANDAAQSFDVFMQVSFEQMLQWLDKRADDKLFQYHVTLHFKDLFIGKGGDSLGGVMGICGFSALFDIPIRQRVTATGSIRADGAIGPSANAMRFRMELAAKATIVRAVSRKSLLITRLTSSGWQYQPSCSRTIGPTRPKSI